ncbi:SusC/RagA family TonB-linked outer membrane protein [Allomuricauda sp. SCSIO 65647]|uniref:SusC/RagA family TonB-linked outer membrane protein n=1 Tax=Allomuricauda sp. SCSIO 65647 TaxID=2908843 RepID=UPI001F3041F7|nr:TonB-dependent receptor [Muricauda sp. SCSIO 65647]UJH67841.1 TonB-dependent receptor [Muricauda sp. SCSIO 65647]
MENLSKLKFFSVRLRPLSMVLCFLLAYGTYAQEKTISGTVTDDQGQPLPGVTIQVKGTTTGTQTDFDGNYSVIATSSDTLIFSYIGFATQEIVVGNQNTVNAALQEDVSQLDEVVVVAYGTTKKAAFTGSASFIETEQIQESATSNLGQALQGLSPGVQVISQAGRPGADAEINIRGFTSLTGNVSPLIILNGSPFEGTLSSIAPTEIESISILKDASSTSLYGSRASGGVILITTKSGTPGKTQVNFRYSLGTSTFAVKLPNKLDAADQYEAVWEGFYYDNLNRGQDDQTARANASASVTDRFYQARPHTNFLGQDRIYRSNWNLDEPVGLNGQIKPEARLLYDYDWHDVFQPKLRQEYSIDVTSGISENTRLFFGSSYLDDKGQYFNQDFRRWSSRLNISTKLADRISLDANMFYVRTDQNNPGEFTRVIRTIPSGVHPYEFNHETGEFFTDVFGNLALQKGGGASYSGRRFFGGSNPFDFSIAPEEPDSYAFDINNTNQFINKLALGIDLAKGLNFTTSFIADYQIFERHRYISPVSGIIEVLGSSFKASNSRTAYTFNNILNYQKSFGDHNFEILLGHEMYSRNRANLSGSGTTFAVPGIFEIDATSAEPASSSNEDNYKLLSGFSRIAYDYNDKIYLNGSFRADGSSRFASENRWGYFWSAGGSYRISQEDFMKDSKVIDNLKLKVSYGTTGNDGDNLYAYQALYNTGFNFFENSGAIESRLPTPGLIWEKNAQFNTGVEFGFFNRIRGNIEYFTTRSIDLLSNRSLPPSFGIGSVQENIGEIENRGIEVALGFDIFKRPNFNWTLNVNASHFKNEIIELPAGEELRGVFKWEEGQSIYDYWLPTWAGVDPETGDNTWFVNTFDDQGNITGREVSNNWSQVNQQENFAYQGTSIPDIYGSVTNIFKYKGFDLSVMFYYSFGGLMLDTAWRENTAMRNAFGLIDYYRDNHWTPENRITDIPRPSVNNPNNRRTTSQFLYNNDFVRLRNLNIGYTFPEAFNKVLNIKSFRLFVQGDNLITWGKANDRGTDPEIAGFDGTSDYNWGIRKTINGGINVQF